MLCCTVSCGTSWATQVMSDEPTHQSAYASQCLVLIWTNQSWLGTQVSNVPFRKKQKRKLKAYFIFRTFPWPHCIKYSFIASVVVSCDNPPMNILRSDGPTVKQDHIIITHHNSSWLIMTHHHSSSLTITHHHSSSRITTHHHSSLLIITHHH